MWTARRYCLDLTGPSVALDTACSSSLVAVDAAISAIKLGKYRMALVAGANIQLRPVWCAPSVTTHEQENEQKTSDLSDT